MVSNSVIVLDGSQGEGGGQVLRTAVALAALTGQAVRVENIRARRKNPGLQRQHLVAIQAAAQLCCAELSGAQLHSRSLEFRPGKIQCGKFRFQIGTAGSCSLVLQTLLPPLWHAPGNTQVEVHGGTHNPLAPPFEFLRDTFAATLARLGVQLGLELVRPGFYPAGGGCIRANVQPVKRWTPLKLTQPGEPQIEKALVLISRLPSHIAQREKRRLVERLSLEPEQVEIVRRDDSLGPGNAVLVYVNTGLVMEVFTGFGQRGKPAPQVADEAAGQALEFLEAQVPVGPWLADQLLIPLALCGQGEFLTCQPSLHTKTNAQVIQRFLPVEFQFQQRGSNQWLIRAQARA